MILVVALIAGIIVGTLFTAIKLPLPAPAALAGILGTVGVYLGSQIVNYIF